MTQKQKHMMKCWIFLDEDKLIREMEMKERVISLSPSYNIRRKLCWQRDVWIWWLSTSICSCSALTISFIAFLQASATLTSEQVQSRCMTPKRCVTFMSKLLSQVTWCVYHEAGSSGALKVGEVKDPSRNALSGRETGILFLFLHHFISPNTPPPLQNCS